MGKKRKKSTDSGGGETGASASNRDEEVELLEHEELLFLGSAQLTVLEGAVSLAGARLEAGAEPVPLSADAQLGGPLLLAPAQPARLRVPLASPCRALLRISSGPQQPPSHQLWRPSAPDAPAHRATPAHWQEALQGVLAASEAAAAGGGAVRIAVAGTRQIGKSSLARLLVNGLLTQHGCVAFLDTDLGQPELTVPGLVSLSLLQQPLLGPPHMHQRLPAAAHWVGDVSPQHEPQLFVAAVTSLLGQYQRMAGAEGEPPPPLVVNTHGWIQGMGLELLAEVLRAAAPTHAALLQSSAARRNLPAGAFWLGPGEQAAAGGVQLLHLPGIGPHGTAPGSEQTSGGKPPPAAVEVRALGWLAWARRCCGLPGPPQETDAAAFAAAAAGLAAQPPFAVPAAEVRVQMLHSPVPASRAAAALNASLVGLACAPSDAAAELGESSPEAAGGEGGLLPCLGVGVVRAVDASKGLLYLLTDLPLEQLQRVTVLQAGRLELPPALLQTAELRSPYLSLWGISTEGSGAGVIKSRNNLARPGQL